MIAYRHRPCAPLACSLKGVVEGLLRPTKAYRNSGSSTSCNSCGVLGSRSELLGGPRWFARVRIGLSQRPNRCHNPSISGSTTPKSKFGRNLSTARVRKRIFYQNAIRGAITPIYDALRLGQKLPNTSPPIRISMADHPYSATNSNPQISGLPAVAANDSRNSPLVLMPRYLSLCW